MFSFLFLLYSLLLCCFVVCLVAWDLRRRRGLICSPPSPKQGPHGAGEVGNDKVENCIRADIHTESGLLGGMKGIYYIASSLL